jgi:putative tryptophan/tyrosine transport system substrate-binding protein
MNRRDTVFALLALGAMPLAAEAQQARKTVPRLGVLLFGTPETDPNLGAFHKGLRNLGYVESQNIAIEYRYASGKPERLPELAAELVATRPNVIFVLGGDVAPFARAATSTIPIVMAVSVDPAQTGLVASLAKPGGNITGVTFVSSDIAAKRLQFLKEAAPRVSRVAVIWNPDHVDPEYRETQKAAQSMGLQIQSLEVRDAGDFKAAFQSAITARAEAVIVVSSRLMLVNRRRIVDFSAEHHVLLVSGWELWAREGALFSYGPDLDLITQRSASYVDRILKGAKPADLPVERPTKFDLVINLKTAKTLGLTIPQSLLVSADKVID